MSLERKIDELVERCIASRGNKSFFAKRIADAGEQLREAFNLYAAVHDDRDATNVLRRHPVFSRFKRVTKNAALLAVKLATEPENAADDSTCSDYARVLRYAVERGFDVDVFVEIFTTGKFRDTLHSARGASPKRSRKLRADVAVVPTTTDMTIEQSKTSDAPISAATILDAGQAETSDPLAGARTLKNGQPSHQESDDRQAETTAVWSLRLSLPGREDTILFKDIQPAAFAHRLIAGDVGDAEFQVHYREFLHAALIASWPPTVLDG